MNDNNNNPLFLSSLRHHRPCDKYFLLVSSVLRFLCLLLIKQGRGVKVKAIISHRRKCKWQQNHVCFCGKETNNVANFYCSHTQWNLIFLVLYLKNSKLIASYWKNSDHFMLRCWQARVKKKGCKMSRVSRIVFDKMTKIWLRND